jgi:hypothetical protein
VFEVVLAVLGEDGVPELALPPDAGKAAGLKGTRRELVALIGPLAPRTVVGDPPQDVDLPVRQRLVAGHMQRSTTTDSY